MIKIRPLKFRVVVTLWVCGILYFSLILATAFFLKVYTNEKLSSVFDMEMGATAQFTSHLENILLTVTDIDPVRVRRSREIVLMQENVCETGGSVTVSDEFSKAITESKFPAQSLSQIPEVQSACRKLAAAPSQAVLFGSSHQFIVPILFYLVSVRSATSPDHLDRLILFSMDGLGRSASDVSVLYSDSGETLWSSAQEEELAFFHFDSNSLKEVITQALSSNLPGLFEDRLGTFASYAPLTAHSVLFSFGSKAALLNPVRQMEIQFIWLLLGSSLLVLLFARRLVQRLSDPLQKLSFAAEELSKGDFSARVKREGDVEFQTVQTAFNRMAGELGRLVEVAKKSSRMESELELARNVQQVLFPARELQVGSHEIRSIFSTASQCGGDWWGCISPDNTSGRFALMIGDVTGHGAPSALVTAAAKGCSSILTEWIKREPTMLDDPRRILELFNQAVYDSSAGSLTMSFLVCVIDPTRGEITLANAGHNWPYLTVKDAAGVDKLTSIGAASPILGASREQKFEQIECHPWTPQSKLILYTDGLIDCFKDDKNLFDKRAFLRVLKENIDQSAAKLLNAVVKIRESKIDGLPPVDDMTLVICSTAAAGTIPQATK